MARRPAITYLDGDARARIDRFLAEKQRTVDEFHAFLTETLGLEISRSAGHRYMRDYDAVASRMRESRNAAAALAQEIGADNLQGKQGRVLIEMFQTLVQDGLLQRLGDDGSEGVSAKDAMMLGRAIKDVLSASKIDVDRETKIREEARRKARQEAAQDVEKSAGQLGLSRDTIQGIKASILGVEG